MFEVDMNCDNFKSMIQEFHDEELEKGKEKFLFLHIANCLNCSSTFILMSRLKKTIKHDFIEMPSRLEDNIFKEIKKLRSNKNNGIISFRKTEVFAYALCVLMIFISIFLYKTSTDYKEKIERISEEVNNQKIRIEILMNSLPTIEITSTRIDTKVN
ncbi:MAG: hypothetical protein KKH32_13630 [Bacteroidetes bacterium]|nr:hypothetical protein [Bacteroidota bacterium]